MTIMVMGERTTNAQLVVDLNALGYLHKDWITLDPTYGTGRFWTLWKPDFLLRSDRYVQADKWVCAFDFTDLPLTDRGVNVVVFDPPYKLNGTSTGKGASALDEGYGVQHWLSWQDRHGLIRDGIRECARVASDVLIVKCQDQVCGGKKRWQTREFAEFGESCGFRLADQLHVGGFRPQPPGRRQEHAQQDYSTALIFKRLPSRTANNRSESLR